MVLYDPKAFARWAAMVIDKEVKCAIEARHRRSAAAKRGWVTRRRNAKMLVARYKIMDAAVG